jgi:hypothetical protein
VTNASRSGLRRRALRTGCIVLVVFVVLECAFDPFSLLLNFVRVAKIRADLPAAQARWQSHAIVDYDIDVQILCMPSYHLDLTLAVRDGKFDSILEAREDWGIGRFVPEDYVISQMLDQIEYEIDHIDIETYSLHVKFDDHYGYVTEHLSDCYRMGLFSPGAGMADCHCQYNVTGFRPLSVPASQLQSKP